jgi:hypothetical protein
MLSPCHRLRVRPLPTSRSHRLGETLARLNLIRAPPSIAVQGVDYLRAYGALSAIKQEHNALHQSKHTFLTHF